MPSITVFHLIWAPLGIEHFRKFLQSYLEHPAGVEHDFVIIYNGFSSQSDILPYQNLIAHVPHDVLFIDQPCLDIAAYRTAARKTFDDYLLFLNSYSVILSDNWLATFYRHASRRKVGLIGATGSYESMYNDNVPLQSPLHELARCCSYFRSSQAPPLSRIRHALGTLWMRTRMFLWFAPFPNYSVRTNAFMIPRNLLGRIKWGRLATKLDAHRFESGRNSLSRQIVRMGYEVLVVGRDGESFDRKEFHRSQTFRSGDQENLLIADNRTEEFRLANADRKEYLTCITWGGVTSEPHPEFPENLN